MKEYFSEPSSGAEKKQPPTPFLKRFSRENSRDERDYEAKYIHLLRRERSKWRKEHADLVAKEDRIVCDLNELQRQIRAYDNAGFLQKITEYLEYRKISAALSNRQGELPEVQRLRTEHKEVLSRFDEPRKILEGFYSREERKWENSGYTAEDLQKYFSEDNLSELSLEEYALLMKRFPGEMVTHVTRQGVRDHADSMWHAGGRGGFSDGFKGMLKDKRLHSALGIALQEHSKEEAMAKFLSLNLLDEIPEIQNMSAADRRKEAMALFNDQFVFNIASGTPFADFSAVHFASEDVMDGMYGGERGNEIFIAYPSAYVASQLHYSSDGGSLVDTRRSAHNNKWVYTEDNSGMPLDAGLVFIPEDVLVDPRSGSKYKTNEDGTAIISQKRIDEILRVYLEKSGFMQSFIEELPRQTEQMTDTRRNRVYENAFREFGITDSDVQGALRDRNFLWELGKVYRGGDKREEFLRVVKRDLSYELAESPITSREYWERYFREHPEQRPSKVVYYVGGNPSRALNKWRMENGIVKRADDEMFGFPEHKINRDHPVANQGKDRFMELARKVIDDRFPGV